MNQNSIHEEKICSIFNKNILSDAAIHEYCMLCGMGYLNLQKFPKCKQKKE
jgi:hypothetical protein